jgi:DNA modification methylase
MNNEEFFNKDIRAKTYKGIYAMHKYWAKKPYNIISEYINHFTKEGEIVLDPFCGSGVAITEALMSNRKAIANDLNPVSTFITEKTTIPLDLKKLDSEFKKLEFRVKPIIDELYTIPCPFCSENVVITHSVWDGDTPKTMWFTCKQCGKKTEPASKSFLNKLEQVNSRKIPHWFPDISMLENSRINVKKGQKIKDLFTHRNLIAATIIFNEIGKIQDRDIRGMMEFVFTSAVPQMTKLMFVIRRRSKDNGKKGKEELGSWVAGYWMPNDRFELHAWNFFINRYKRVKRGKVDSDKIKKYEPGKNIFYYNESAKELKSIKDNSVDYIFTDPPYADYVPYFEQSLLWASWLKKDLDFEKEIVISNSPERTKNVNVYLQDLEQAFQCIASKLKPNKYMTVTFNSVKHNIWDGFLNAVKSSGFRLINIKSISSSACSVVQDSRNGALKGDLYLTFQKTLSKNKPLTDYFESIDNNNVTDLIKEFLIKNGASTYHDIYSHVMPKVLTNGSVNRKTDIMNILQKSYILEGTKWNIKS